MGFSDYARSAIRNNRKLQKAISKKYFKFTKSNYSGQNGPKIELADHKYEISEKKRKQSILRSLIWIVGISIIAIYFGFKLIR